MKGKNANSGPTIATTIAKQQLEQAFPEVSRASAAQIIALKPGMSLAETDTDVLMTEIAQHVSALATALESHDQHAFIQYIQSADASTETYDDLRLMIEVLAQVIRQHLGEPVWSMVKPVLDSALEWLSSQTGLASSAKISTETNIIQGYTHNILKGNRVGAEKLVFDALAHGYTVRDIYLKVIQPSLYEVGRLWEIGQVSIPQENLATAITQSVLSAIYARVELPSSLEKHALVACLENNFHEIGPRMLADFLQMAGYNTRFLGTNTSVDCLMEMIQTLKPGVIGLPATTQNHVEGVKLAIERLRADFTSYRPTIMVGGLAFNYSDGLWKTVKADLWSADGGQAVDLLVGSSDWV
jgi:MerR family transcriptional regulator, light-induced transcriptional regulator